MKGFWLAILVSFLGVSAGAQGVSRVLRVTVGDANGGVLIADADISIISLGLRARTDSTGRALIPGIPAGAFSVEARRLGYVPAIVPIEASGADTIALTVILHRSTQPLPSVSVVDSAVPFNLREFESRRRRHIGGYFITDKELRAVVGGNIADLATSKIPGIRVQLGADRSARVYSLRGSRPCQAAVFLDGVKVTNGDAGIVPLQFLGGIEYYSPGFAPVQYRMSPSVSRNGPVGGGIDCGVMLLWSRP